MRAEPIQIPGRGWDVRIADAHGERLLCGGRAPYTLHQAQIAADAVRRDAWCPRCQLMVDTIDEGATCARCGLVL
jgi:ribosomal protein S27AE